MVQAGPARPVGRPVERCRVKPSPRGIARCLMPPTDSDAPTIGIAQRSARIPPVRGAC
jgi:hypothetical protein